MIERVTDGRMSGERIKQVEEYRNREQWKERAAGNEESSREKRRTGTRMPSSLNEDFPACQSKSGGGKQHKHKNTNECMDQKNRQNWREI